MTDATHRASRRAVLLSRAGSVLAALSGLTVVIGWVLDLPRLTYVFVPFGPNVKTNAGVALVSAGLANLLLLGRPPLSGRRLAGWALATACLAIGTATLFEHVSGRDLGIDQLLATEPPGALATTEPNRMGPPASTAFLLIGLSLLLLDAGTERVRRWGHAAALVASLVALLPLIGYAYGLTAL